MRNFRFVRVPRRVAWVLGSLALGAALPTCADRVTPSPSGEASVPSGGKVVAGIQARFPGAIAAHAAKLTTTAAGGLESRSAAEHALAIDLPPSADEPVRVSDEASGVSVSFALEGAKGTKVVLDSGYAFYAGAAPGGGDVIHRADVLGDEDFVYYEHEPAQNALRYRLDVSKVAGLRLVENTLEALDAKGAPRIRVTPPEVTGADGKRSIGTLTIEGCAFDASPKGPWGRPVTAPGKGSCTVAVAWPSAGVLYPALVDPSWVSTSTMKVERAFHAVVTLPDSSSAKRLLFTGGFDKNGALLSSAEIYEPLSQTFSTTASMTVGRAAHTATATASGPIVIAGGAGQITSGGPPAILAITSATNSASTELYDPDAGTFAAGPAMSSPRFFHTATALVDGRVLIAGGQATGGPVSSGDLVTVTATPSLTIDSNHPTLATGRYGHASALLTTGAVLVTGGIATGGAARSDAEIFCPPDACADFGTDFFEVAPSVMSTPRAFHTATGLGSSGVLVSGGISGMTSPSYLATAELYLGAQFQTPTIALSGPRAFHTATALAPALLLHTGGTTATAAVFFAAGYDGTTDLVSSEAYFPSTGKITRVVDNANANVNASVGRRYAVASLVNSGGALTAGAGVILAGGVSGTTATKSVELFFKSIGDACRSNGECNSGHCADGYCCDTACATDCFSCAASLKDQGQANGNVNGICGYTVADHLLPVTCSNKVEIHNHCDGTGHVKSGEGTHSCTPSVCGSNGLCTNFCTNDGIACDVTGWCDFSTLPDGGIPDASSGATSSSSSSSSSGAGGGGGMGGAGSSGTGGAGGSGGASATGTGGGAASAGSSSSSSSSSSSGGGVTMYGSCVTRGSFGDPCTEDSHCLHNNDPSDPTPGKCWDGFCVDQDCSLPCQIGTANGCQLLGSAASPQNVHTDAGFISSALGTHHTRVPCLDQGTTCGGTCQGDVSGMCVFPDKTTTDAPPTCADQPDGAPSIVTTHPCQGTGVSAPAQVTCDGDFVCAADKTQCLTSCSADKDCLQDHFCDAKKCVAVTNPVCDGKVTLRRTLAEGGNLECPDHYACLEGDSACKSSCTSINDCAPGFVCDHTDTCVEPPSAPALPSCSVSATGGDAGRGLSGAAFFTALGALAFGARRRRRG